MASTNFKASILFTVNGTRNWIAELMPAKMEKPTNLVYSKLLLEYSDSNSSSLEYTVPGRNASCGFFSLCSWVGLYGILVQMIPGLQFIKPMAMDLVLWPCQLCILLLIISISLELCILVWNWEWLIVHSYTER